MPFMKKKTQQSTHKNAIEMLENNGKIIIGGLSKAYGNLKITP